MFLFLHRVLTLTLFFRLLQLSLLHHLHKSDPSWIKLEGPFVRCQRNVEETNKTFS